MAQQPSPSAVSEVDFLPAGPFLFGPGTIRPTPMDAFGERPVVKSPDGKLGVTVTGPRESFGAWVTISPSIFPDGPVQVWPIQRSVAVLWRRDSQAFALTDNRYANTSYALVCGTEFRMGENEPGLGVPISDLTPIVRKAFEELAQEYYKTDNYDTLLFYAKVLSWTQDNDLLIGVSARTSGPAASRDLGVREWDLGYLVDVPNRKVVREVDREHLLSEYKIKVPY